MQKDNLKNETPTGNTVLPAVLFVGAKLYRTYYNVITEVITIERVTKTQAIAKGDTYKFSIEVSSYGTARKLGNIDKWSSASFYLETPKLQEQLWKQETVTKLKETDFSKLSTEVLKELLSLVNGR
jgi:hypothetical protein